ncbi:hypothetical protein [Leptospira wolffii]|uniref:DUF5683 domain-containing protein n=1 Tax=Leptospira wolffii TaxID=409998 RepID=A0A2M9ZDU5_9LEPT|nr:hypothetical protein [Leptospira wolffii]EPG65160.1 hypothetical protein LEP1GSC061_2484 [Leptospira wolffii serovar Khorat str. Khorat-H2]PJZ66589.1 hypothetical protein CH371_00275 [Leptospira wolffii]
MKRLSIPVSHSSAAILLFFLSFGLLAQTQSDFSDPYDYNLRNYKDEKSPDGFREYSIPPKFEKPPLVNPKNVQIPFQNGLPSATGSQGTRRTTNPVVNRNDDGLFNPITGEVNTEALERQQEQARERKRKLEEFGKDQEPYTESRLRRFSIIFFMTLPLAAGFSYGTLSAANPGYQKTFEGGWIVFGAAATLAFTNAWLDLRDYDKMKLENQPQSPTPNPTVPDKLSEIIHPSAIPGLGVYSRNLEYRMELELFRSSF